MGRGRQFWRDAIAGYAMASPWIIGFILFTAGPVLLSLYYSFTFYRITASPRWIGLNNYKVLVSNDPLFTLCLTNTIYYAALSVPLSIITALILAMLMNQRIPGRALFRTIYYLPSVVSGVANAMLWLWIFNPRLGLINRVLGVVGIRGPAWIFSYEWAKPSMVLMSMWSVGGTMVIFLAGLQGIPEHLMEAAHIDGANAWRRFWNVTIPMLSPTIFFNLVTHVIGSFQVFTQVYIWTHRHDPSGGSAGPRNSLLFYVLYLFNKAFGELRMGYASAMAWILFLIILALTLIQFGIARHWVYYESAGEGVI
ncbi:MAG: sugar ABC transporter permease [Chloroflexi bacterium]|nr:sugar ABC transporter permease [Chloroflexota bacterium]